MLEPVEITKTKARARPKRSEVLRDILSIDEIGIIQRKLSPLQIAFDQGWMRKTILLLALALIWELEARHLDNDLLIPSLQDSVIAFYQGFLSGELPARIMISLQLLMMGYVIGIGLAVLLTVIAIGTRVGRDFLEMVTAMMNPLPAIALLPLALIWFGLGAGSIVFVLIHSVLWPVSLNMYSGFRGVSPTLRMVGRNYGLGGLRFVIDVLIPAAFPSILTGLKIGWAFGWRTLIAAELVFGASSGGGGLGWYIFQNKTLLNIPEVFAGLLAIIMIGLIAENVIFRVIERATVIRWGMNS